MRANYTLSLAWGLGKTTICCRGRAVDQTSDSVAQCSPNLGNVYFQQSSFYSCLFITQGQRYRGAGGLRPSNFSDWGGSAPPIFLLVVQRNTISSRLFLLLKNPTSGESVPTKQALFPSSSSKQRELIKETNLTSSVEESINSILKDKGEAYRDGPQANNCATCCLVQYSCWYVQSYVLCITKLQFCRLNSHL